MKHILIAVGCVLVAGPARAQNREERAHMQMAAELRILQTQQVEAMLAIANLTQSLAEATKALSARVDALDNSLKKHFADQGLAIGTVATDVRGINERSRETITRLGELKEEVEELRKAILTLATRPAAVAPVDPVNPDAPVPPDISQAPPVAVPPTTAIGLSARRLFDAGWADYAGGNYASAIASFQQVVKDYATSESADDALYYIGESHFQQRRFDEAIAAYNQVIQDYAKGDMVAAAYFKLGLSHENLQRYDSARAAWQQLIKLHPNTPEAGLATQGLGRITKAAGAPPKP
jgi:tol-pal system protein YbgF